MIRMIEGGTGGIHPAPIKRRKLSMKKLLQVISVLLCCLLLFAACGNNDGGNPQLPSGRYVQKDITPPGLEDQTLEVLQDKDGKLIVYSEGLQTRYESSDGGENWSETDGPGKNNPELATMSDLTLGEDGTLYGLKRSYDGMTPDEIVKILPDGTVEPVAVEDYDSSVAAGKKPHISMLKALPQGKLLVQFYEMGDMMPSDNDVLQEDENSGEPDGGMSSGEDANIEDGDEDTDEPDGMSFSAGGGQITALYEIETGKMVGNAIEWYGFSATSDADTVYLLDMEGGVQAFSLENGEKKEVSYKAPSIDFMSMPVLSIGADGKLYLCDSKAFSQLNADGTTEAVLNPASFALGDPSGYIKALYNLGEQAFAVNLETEAGSKLYKYVYDPDATIDPEKTLNVWSLYNNSMVRAAITKFMEQNPDALVNYEVALGDEATDEQAVNDAINNLNTELLAGKGPDILLMDGLPADSFVAKGMLMNLDGMVDTSGMYDEIASHFKTENGTFMLPSRFAVPVLIGSGEALEEANELEKLVAAVVNGADMPQANFETGDPFAVLAEEERPALGFGDWEELYNILWQASAGKIIDENGIDTDQLRTFLESMKRISDKYGLLVEPAGGSMGAVIVSATSSGGSVLSGAGIAYMMQRATYGSMMLDSLSILSVFDAETMELASFPGLDVGAWQPQGLFGINANTDVSGLAAQFIQTMLSKEVQSSLVAGLPVTSEGTNAQITRLDEIMSQEGGPGFSFDMDALLSQLAAPVMDDTTVNGKVMQTARSYCSGEMDIDAALGKIEQDLKIYLAERN